ncbi:MAG: protease complex subunit PrcB family protein [Lachnospira sp.]|nr:protease complex subunit PrcB family protein [Lachnospira sp.]
MLSKNRKYYAVLILKLTIIVFIVATAYFLTGCSATDMGSEKVSELDFTVVEDADLPVELKKLIDEKKATTLRMTYTTKDYTYMVVGYGTQETSGYSIKVNDVYLGENAVCMDVSLIGPAADEPVSETQTTPYIVVKIEKREEPVVFKI